MPRKTLVTSTLVAILFSCDAASAQAAKGISLPPVFADHMVLQRNRPVTIWGRAPSGTEIEVAFAGQRQTATATDADEWSVMLPAMPASRTGRKMLIRAIGEPTEMILLSDVVCGDVWVCAGQSNMRWRVRQSAKADEMLESAAMPDLRLIDFEGSLHTSGKAPDLAQLHSVNADNYYTTNGWHRSSRATAASFSAVAFAFGRRLTQELEVPIGVIHNAIGGAPIEAYLPSGGSEVDPAVRDVMKSWWTDPRTGVTAVLLTNQMWPSPTPPPVFDAFRAVAFGSR